MYLYKEDNNWVCGPTTLDSVCAGTYIRKANSETNISLISHTPKYQDYLNLEITDIYKNSTGDKYSSVAEFKTACNDFFVKAPFSWGYPIVESSVSGTNIINLEFCKAIVQTNTLVSTDIFTLTLTPITSTNIGEYIYSFTTGATPPTIVWPVECKESIVISPNKKYLISFVRVSATKVFTFIDEEVV